MAWWTNGLRRNLLTFHLLILFELIFVFRVLKTHCDVIKQYILRMMTVIWNHSFFIYDYFQFSCRKLVQKLSFQQAQNCSIFNAQTNLPLSSDLFQKGSQPSTSSHSLWSLGLKLLYEWDQSSADTRVRVMSISTELWMECFNWDWKNRHSWQGLKLNT